MTRTLWPFSVDWHVPSPFSTGSFGFVWFSTARLVADRSQMRIVRSSEPETSDLPSVEKATLFVGQPIILLQR